jgi:hypothetical protein
MNDRIMQKMRQLKFFGMANAFKLSIEDGRLARLTADEMVAFLIE